MIKITPMQVEGLDVYMFEAEQGDDWVVDVPPGLSKMERANLSVYLEGRARAERSNHPLVDYREAGTSTLDLEWVTDDPGRVRYTVESAKFKYLCVSHPDSLPLREEVQKLQPGAQLAVPRGKRVLLAAGDCAVNDMMQLEAFASVSLRNNPAVFTAGEAGALLVVVEAYHA